MGQDERSEVRDGGNRRERHTQNDLRLRRLLHYDVSVLQPTLDNPDQRKHCGNLWHVFIFTHQCHILILGIRLDHQSSHCPADVASDADAARRQQERTQEPGVIGERKTLNELVRGQEVGR